MSAQRWDLVVLGSGAAGLSAAVTAAHGGCRVLVLEKADELGGTTAWSGGNVWVPNNPHAAEIGVEDSEDEAVEYLLSLSRGLMDPDLVRAFVRSGREMVAFMDDVADMRFFAYRDYPDYHAERPGGKAHGGRTLEAELFSFQDLGEWAHRVTVSPYYRRHQMMLETPTGSAVPRVVPEEEWARRAERDERGMGQALVGRLLRAALDLGVEFRTGTRGEELVRDPSGRVTGVVVSTADGRDTVEADRGVVLATGGFEWDERLRRAFLRGPLTHPVTVPTNEGDGLRMAMRIGAMLGNMREAWWTTVTELPEGINRMNRFMLSGDRSRPRSIMVNRQGRRFANESTNYNAFGGAFHQEDTVAFDYANLPCWLVFDQGYLERFGTVGHPAPGPAPEWVAAAPTLRELADRVGIDPEGLERTVEEWNANVAQGRDPHFHRGEFAHDRWWGDPSRKGTIEASLGPLDRGPFYAIPVHIGALGTKGGPQIDEAARVLSIDGDVIPGLYAAGNVMASPFGMTYGGAGGTLGPAMTAGYLAGRHVAGSR